MIWKRQTGDRIALVATGKNGKQYTLGSITQYSEDGKWDVSVFGIPKDTFLNHPNIMRGWSNRERALFTVEWHVRNALAGPLGRVLLNIEERAPREEGV